MEEKSIEQLRREAQELYQSKLQAYQQAQKETTQKKETAPKLFLKTEDLKKILGTAFFKSEEKKVVQSEKQEVLQSKPQDFQQVKRETPQILKKPGITITEKVFEPAFMESGSREKNIDELRRESQELYQSRLQTYQQTQEEATPGVFQESKKGRLSVLTKKNISAGTEEAETAALTSLKKSLKQRNNLFIISVFIIMVIIVLVKLLLFMP